MLTNTDQRDPREPPEPRPTPDLTDFLENAPVPIHTVDAAGTVLWANRAELALLGYQPHEYVGRPSSAFHADRAALGDMCTRLARGEPLRDHAVQLRCKDGAIRHVLVSSTVLATGGRRAAARCFLRDVTDETRARAERDQATAELDRTVRLNELFAGVLGHDLSGALGSIVMASQVLLGSIDEPRSARTVQRVLDSADRMQRMIDQLLDFARARDGDDAHAHARGATEPAPDAAEGAAVGRPGWKLEERFRMLVDSIKDYAIFVLDADGHVMTWNTGAQRIKGYTADEIVGQHFSVFYPTEDRRDGKTERELEISQRLGRFEDEGWRLRKDGSQFWANVVITALRDASGALLGYAKITRDLTERRKLEDERLDLARAQEAVRLRDEFLSLASHELKTPLTVLQLQLEALRERVDVDDRPTIAKLDRSTRAVRRLAELIDALLDVSRIATGRFELQLERADLADVVATAVDRLHEAADAAGCRLAVTGDPVVGQWDRSRIDQVVSNLVCNAIRYAAGAPIDVAVKREPDGVAIEVRDRGPGLPEGQLARIFERFERAASMRHYGGLGLGLYVVRQIAEAHGGGVTARNVPGGGACFTVRLPVTVPPHDPVA